ncbi:MBL fold metallo-hydrolase [Corynebacterium sp.]|uniref:MBL fold metallo-hydrolase n=1 Tax=Corynebacterium sp. TaxID=1720 RepID=UPI0026DD2D1F|nr:MBL fold metallo-hydrolase [Corynebacterium sp.]MDO5077939.1 MBL fold metallo-hydrolase [Corynebacterium sp.]
MTTLSLHHISVSDMDNNCYLLTCGQEALLIDAADNAPALLQLAADHGAKITTVITTHSHADHVRALPEVLAATNATHIASALDAPALPCPVDVETHDNDTVTFAGHEFPVRILRGHTDGGMAIAVEINGKTHLFVGDSLFPGGVGKTNSPAKFTQLLDDVTERIFECYPDDAIVHPGHGKPTTLGQERPHLAQWRERGW